MKIYEGCGNRFMIDEKMQSLEKMDEKNCDGFLFLEREKKQMTVYNRDKTTASLCVNGLRCARHYLYDEGILDKEIKIKIQDRTYPITYYSKYPFICTVTLDIPMMYKNFVDVGNSHYIILGKDTSEAEKISRRYDCNVNYVCVKNANQICLTTYERGVGFTKSCGSGACASAYYCMENHICNAIVEVIQTGGVLVVEKEKDSMKVTGKSEEKNELY